MDDTLRDRVEAELDRREAEAHTAAAPVERKGDYCYGHPPYGCPRLEFDPADALRRYAAARRILARHRPILWESLTGERRCARCGDTLDCPEIADLAASLGLSTTTSEEQRHG